VVAVVASLAVVGIGVSALMFSHWSDLEHATVPEVSDAFATAIRRAGGPAAYLRIDSQGRVQVNRQLESDHPTKLRTLHLLAWDPKQEKLLQVAFPYWFVRVKMNEKINLGTITSALSHDWDKLDLKISTQELRLRGPGVVLDHTGTNGMRVLLWSEAAEAP
jgi:hypothetical protein